MFAPWTTSTRVARCIRGFAPAGLGPRDQLTGDALGGKNFYCATAEIRFPLPFIPEDMGFGGAIFADAGSVWGTDADKLALSLSKRKRQQVPTAVGRTPRVLVRC